jgi:hypothetical protein
VRHLVGPIRFSENYQSASDRFIQAFSRDLDGMFDAVDVATAESATPNRQPSMHKHIRHLLSAQDD